MNQKQSKAIIEQARAKYEEKKQKNDEVKKNYAEKLEQGLIFQDVVREALYQRGIIIIAYVSRRFQINKGENILGAEIKNDARFRETGKLYIEVAEKTHPDRPNYTKSGIERGDNSWLFIIGDEKTFWIFDVKHLRKLKDKYQQVTTPTSKGFLLTPLKDADEYCILKIEPSIKRIDKIA